MSEREPRRVVKVTTNLPVAVFDALESLSVERGVTMTEVLRQAISTEKFFQDALDRGEAVMIANQDMSSVREVFFPGHIRRGAPETGNLLKRFGTRLSDVIKPQTQA